MSLEVIKQCKSLKMAPTQKAVLMAVAWYASDDGEYWGAVSTICEHTCLSERAVRKTLHDLVALGHLRAEIRNGTSTKYTVTPCTICTPAQYAPLHQMQESPAPDAPPPLHIVQGTPARGAPNKQLTTNTKTVNNKNNAGAKAAPSLPDWLPEKPWADFLEFRKSIKKPMTPRAQELAIADLAEMQAKGIDPVAVINQSIVRGWAGLFEPKTMAGGQPPRHSGFEKRNYHEGVNADGSF